MNRNDVVLNGVYWDGKLGLRRIVRVDVPPSDLKYHGSGANGDQDFVEYTIVHAKAAQPFYRQGEPNFCTRASMASWAKARIPEEDVAAKKANLVAQSVKVSKAAAELMFNLSPHGPHAVVLPPGKARVARTLVPNGLVIMTGNAARLDEAGWAWLALQSQQPKPAIGETSAPPATSAKRPRLR